MNTHDMYIYIYIYLYLICTLHEQYRQISLAVIEIAEIWVPAGSRELAACV